MNSKAEGGQGCCLGCLGGLAGVVFVSLAVDPAFSVVGFILGALTTMLGAIAIIPTWRTEAQIKFRKWQAVRRKIRERTLRVVATLGKEDRFRDDRLDIEASSVKTLIKERRGAEWFLVFEIVYVPANYSVDDLGTYIVPQEDGSSKLVKKTTVSGTSESWSVLAFVPGEWEAHLLSLARIAERKAWEQARESYKQQQVESARKAAEERQRFGI